MTADPANDSHEPIRPQSRVSFRTPWGARGGDLLTVAWQFPLTYCVVGFCTIMLFVGLGQGFELEGDTLTYMMWASLVLLFALLLPMTRGFFRWRIVLHPSYLELGYTRLGGQEVPYDAVKLIKRSKTRSMERERDGAHAISVKSKRGEIAIWLAEAQAEQCFQQLRQRCRAAAAHDVDGTDYLPPDPEHAAEGLKVLGGLHLTAGRVALVTGLGLTLAGVVPIALALNNGEFPSFRAFVWASMGVAGVVSGFVMRRRGRGLRREGQGIAI